MVCGKCPAKIPLMRIDANVKRALCVRLKHFQEAEESEYKRWEEMIKPKLKPTLADIIDRRYRQRIQAFKMVIWVLTPTGDRTDEFPGFSSK